MEKHLMLCDQCKKDITEQPSKYRLTKAPNPGVRMPFYSFDFCSVKCLEAWAQQHPDPKDKVAAPPRPEPWRKKA